MPDAVADHPAGATISDGTRLAHFVAGVSDYAIYMLSPSGHVNSWNLGAQRFKQYTAADIIGKHFSLFYTEEDRANGLPERALRCASEHGKFEGEGWRVRKDGSRFWASVVIDTIRDADGELIGFVKVTRDITERREAALELERTKDALFHAQKMEALGKLTGGVAHDFNNLLGVIVSGIELLAREGKTPANERILESMRRAAKRGATLTQQLLAFARQQPLAQADYDLNRLIGECEAVLRRAAGDVLTFQLALQPSLGLVKTDAAQFEATLLNLISNARDAMPDGGVLTIRTAGVQLADGEVVGLPAGEYVRVDVDDTGCGMAPDVLGRAIEPFFTTKPVGKGTGLGLSQTYGLVQQSGGQLLLQSRPGAGTTVTLFFPRQPGERDAEGAATIATGKEIALVVDDQPDVLDIAVELFKTLGYEVLSANSGAEALAVLRRVPALDVLFSDIVMPGMNGVQLGLEAVKLHPRLHVLLASGYADADIAEQMSAASQFQNIKKPYRMAEIVRKLRQHA